MVSAAVDRKGHAAARREIRVIGQLQRLPVVRHCAEAVQQRAAARRQVQGEHRSIRRVLAVERRSKAAAAHRLAIAHSGNAGAHTVQVAKRAHLTALQIACAHRQGGCGEVFHREVHQHIAHFLRRGIAQQLHGSFAVQQGRFACKTRLLRRCRYAGEQRCRKADRTGAGTFQE